MDWFEKITPQTTILTPNRRLAAVISDKYSQWQQTKGLTCWTSLDILPLFPTWLDRTVRNLIASDIVNHPLLLTAQQELILWEKTLAETTNDYVLLQVSETAKLAKSAWEILKRWNIDIKDPRLVTTEDGKALVKWAEKFNAMTVEHEALDQHSFADFIKTNFSKQPDLIPRHLILIGFADISPQYQALLATLENLKCRVEYEQTPFINQKKHFISLPNAQNEIQSMALWAKEQFVQSKFVGCVVPNLETDREEVTRVFSTVFLPNEFNISAGKSLIKYPAINDAFALLQSAYKTLPIEEWTRLLKSPFLGEAEQERARRAEFEVRLHELNINNLSLNQLIEDKQLAFHAYCPAFFARLKRLNSLLQELAPGTRLTMSDWIDHFNTILISLGWPGERSLNSQEYQVIQNAWVPLLSLCRSLSNLFEPIKYKEALHYLHRLAKETIFQPETPKASVQVLGLLEAADIPFDACWVLGLDDMTWPPRPKPNPFIPLQLQKTCAMPNASAERELNYCRSLTNKLIASSTEIIFSYAKQKEDTPLRPSSLIKQLPELELCDLNLPELTPLSHFIFDAQQFEYLQDDIAPSISSDVISGGVRIFKTQAECHFKAFAELRLHAKKIEKTTYGIRKLDRGNITHKALETIWREIQSSEKLLQLSDPELIAIIHNAVTHAMADVLKIPKQNNQRYLALELLRIEKLLFQWLQKEKLRPPFKIHQLEAEVTTTIGKITAQFRIDRIDKLELSDKPNLVIIDYKTSKQLDRKGWFGARLEEPQLPLYCLFNSEDIVGIAFAKIHPDNMGMIGASRLPLDILSVATLTDIQHADATLWNEQLNTWKQNLEQLGNDFHQGKAEVNPKDPIKNCQLCELTPFCRRYELPESDPIHEATE